MTRFDLVIIHAVNDYAQHSAAFDALIHGFANNYLLKSAGLMVLIYMAWFTPQMDQRVEVRNRKRLLVALASALIAPITARILALILPFRYRPMHEEGLNFILPHYMRPDVDIGWSSFPSDTTALLFPLAVGLFMVSRRYGWVAFPIVLMAMFARVYSGLHYPTDVLAGAVLGTAVFFAIDMTRLKVWLTRPCFWAMEKYPQFFYPAFFLLTYQITNIFWESYTILKHLLHHGSAPL